MTIDKHQESTSDSQQKSNMTSEDLIKQFGSSSRPAGTTDAGAQARAKIVSRSDQVKRTIVATYLLLTTVVLVLVAGLCWYIYEAMNAPGRMVTDTRPCALVDEARGIDLTGRRHYSYMERELFGIHYRDSSKVKVETELDVRGTAMNVVGLSNDAWWAVHIGTGEKGIQLLKSASVLVFNVGNKSVVVNDSVFCK